MADYRGARGSNTGDDFHELWATRQAIGLLNAENGLQALALEGTLEPGAADTWDGVDCTLYFGGDGADTAERVRLEQLKYSGSSPGTPWTVARLTYVRPPPRDDAAGPDGNGSKPRARRGRNKTGLPDARSSGDGSVLSRMAKAWSAMRALRPGKSLPEVALVTNQPVAPELRAAFQRAARVSATSPPVSGPDETDEAKLLRASGLPPESFREFAACLDLVAGTGSRFALEDRMLRAMAEWSDGDARADTLVLRQFVRQRMLPEHDRSPITREGVMLQALGASDRRALFPCPPDLKPARSLVRRADVEAASRLLATEPFLCLHGEGGVGKTTALRQIEGDLPEGSVMVVFDCYGGGRYLDPAELRHHPADAFTQLANEVATRLRLPLLLRRHGNTDFPRMFVERLRRAAAALAARSPGAFLVVAVDAADNSVTAARERPTPETSFVHDFVRLGSLPENVRFIVTARTGRVGTLNLPESYRRVPVRPFERPETEEFVRARLEAIPGHEWTDEFHALSGGIPRVQAYAFEGGGGEQAPLARLRPGKSLDAVFEERFRVAMAKNGGGPVVSEVCAGLIALARPVPLPALAAVLGTNEHHVRDICRDLAPGVRIHGDAATLADEDFEAFVRARGESELASIRSRSASWLLSLANAEPYAAVHVGPALAAAGRFADLLELVEREPVPRAVRDPVQRREVEVQRLALAVAASRAAGEPARALRYVLIGAEGHRKDEALRNLLAATPDLAARFAADTVGRLLLSDPDHRSVHGRILYHRLLVHAEREDALSYREDGRAIGAWYQARQSIAAQSDERRSDPWPLDSEAVAADIEAALRLGGPLAAVRQLERWRPKAAHAEVGLELPPRLVANGRATDLVNLLASGMLGTLPGVFLRVPLALAGEAVDDAALEEGLLRLFRLLRGGRGAEHYRRADGLTERLVDLLLTGCEVLTARAPQRKKVDAILKRLLGGDRRRIDRNHASNPAQLDAVFRAYALLEARAGRRASATAVFEPRAEAPKDTSGHAKPDRYAEQHDHEMRSLANGVFPLYAAVASALAERDTDGPAVAALSSAANSLRSETWRLQRGPGFHSLRSLAARSILSLLAANYDPSVVYGLATSVEAEWTGGETPPDPALVSRLSLRPALHEALVAGLSASAKATRGMRIGARTKTDSLIAHARLMVPLSLDDAASVFQMAVDAAGELDIEIRSQLLLVDKLVACGSRDAADRRGIALRLGEVVADAAIRLDGERHFPWPEAMAALARLDQPVALAAASRWEARGVVQLWETLPPVLRTGLTESSLMPGEAAALALCIEAGNELLEEGLRASQGLSPAARRALHEEAARDLLLRPGRRGEAGSIGNAPPRERGPLAQAVVDMEQFFDELRPPTPDPTVQEPRKGDELIAAHPWTAEMTTDGAALDTAIRKLKKAAEAGRTYVSLGSMLSAARKAVPLRDRAKHLDAIVVLGEEHGRGETARALIDTLDDWDNPAIAIWCATALPRLVRDWLPALSAGGPFRRDEITSLLDRADLDRETKRDLLLDAVQAHVDALDPDALLATAGLVASLLPASSVADLLDWYIGRLMSRVHEADLERIDPNALPEDAPGAVGRFLMVQMGSADSRARWRAAHAVRRLTRTSDFRAVEAFVREFGRTEDLAFSAPIPAYYPLAAKLWTAIALDRIAAEHPHAAAKAAPALLATALDEEFPHLLLRAFARDACLKLAGAGVLTSSPQEMARLEAVNRSALPAAKADDRLREDVHQIRTRDGRRFRFDVLDTLPYWYEPIWRAFSEPVGERFLDAAERWIVDVWGWPEERVRDAPTLPWWMARDRDYAARRHGHGSRPVVEVLDTHLEWHAMWCAAGELLRSVPLAEGEPDDWDALDHRVRREQLAEAPLWTADLLAPTPLHPRHWGLGGESLPHWVAAVREADHRVGMLPPERDGYVTVAGREETTGADRSQETVLSSALVEPSTAPALLRALQTMQDSWDYKLPEEGESRFEFDEPPYRLVGWLVRPERYEGIDEHDPFRGQARHVHCAPGARVVEACGLARDAAGAATWSRPGSGEPMFVFEVWGARESDEDRHRTDVRANGWRLLARKEELRRFLGAQGLDLVVEVGVTRRGSRTGRHAGEEGADPAEARFDRVYRLGADGGLDIAEGRLGSWQESGPEPRS